MKLDSAAVKMTASQDQAEKSGSRLKFLDGLRAIAALSVVGQHAGELLYPQFFGWSITVWRPGQFGVFLFFIISGFVIPYTIGRYRSPLSFAFGRFFRIFPLLAAATAFVLLTSGQDYSLGVIVANLFAVHLFFTNINIVGSSWTLYYELIFYVLIGVAFFSNRLPNSLRVISVIPLLPLLLNGSISGDLLFGSAAKFVHSWEAIAVVLAFSVILAMAIAGHALSSLLKVLPFAVVVGFLLFHNYRGIFYNLTLVQFFAIGVLYYFHYTKRLATRHLVMLLIANAVMILINFRIFYYPFEWPAPQPLHDWLAPYFVDADKVGRLAPWWTDPVTYICAIVVFSFGYFFRYGLEGRVITWLGMISYSIYIVHSVIIHHLPQITGSRIVTFFGWMAISVVVSWLTYRLIEDPFHRLGRLAARWADTLSDRPPRHEAAVAEMTAR
ncbi:acyltransferase family protein [Inquilinus limosus]|nr:acyltransferase [Inquilinus limosus]